MQMAAGAQSESDAMAVAPSAAADLQDAHSRPDAEAVQHRFPNVIFVFVDGRELPFLRSITNSFSSRLIESMGAPFLTAKRWARQGGARR